MCRPNGEISVIHSTLFKATNREIFQMILRTKTTINFIINNNNRQLTWLIDTDSQVKWIKLTIKSTRKEKKLWTETVFEVRHTNVPYGYRAVIVVDRTVFEMTVIVSSAFISRRFGREMTLMPERGHRIGISLRRTYTCARADYADTHRHPKSDQWSSVSVPWRWILPAVLMPFGCLHAQEFSRTVLRCERRWRRHRQLSQNDKKKPKKKSIKNNGI